MNLCFVTRGDLFPAHHGAAVRILRVAEAYERLGARVCLIDEDPDGYLRLDQGRWSRVAFPARARAAEEWPPQPLLRRWIDRLLLRVGYPPEEFFLYRPLMDPGWILRALTVGLKENIDVFQAEFPAFGLPALVAARILGARVCVVEHNVEYDRLAQTLGLGGVELRRLRLLERSLLRLADDVFAMNAEDRARMIADGVAAEKISIVPHGVEVESLRRATGAGIRARHGIAPDAPLLFFHGVLHYGPNARAVRFIADELLPRLLPLHPELRVLVVGQGAPRWYEHPAILFPGAVDDLAEYIAASDVAICPLDQGGGTRMKLLEYFAAGRAVVSTAKGAEGLRCQDGREILIRDSAEDLARAVEDLLADPTRRGELGREAAAFAACYPWSAVADAGLRIFGGEGRGQDWNERFLERRGLERVEEPQVLGDDPVEGHLPPDRLRLPRVMLLLINQGCNLRCTFCDLWRHPAQMDVPGMLLPLLDQAAALGTRTVVITGGEPLLHPALFDAVRRARALGMSTELTTNGLLVPERWREILDSGLNSLSVSLDGLAQTHDALRGRPGAWELAMRAVRLVSTGRGPTLSIHMTVTRANVGEIEQVWRIAREHGASFDLWPVQGAPELELSRLEDVERWRAAILRLAELDPEMERRRGYHLEELETSRGRVRCLGLVDQFGVTWDGRLLACCQWSRQELVVGNLGQASLHELWRGEVAQEARRRLFETGCEGCANHSLLDFTRSTGLDFRIDGARAEGRASGAQP